MKLSIIIPAHNEKNTIREIIERIKKVNIGDIEKEIIVIDDGSIDGTREILNDVDGIRYIFHEQNLGKGGAVKTGFRESNGDMIIIQDADLEYDPNDYTEMIKPALLGKTEMVLGVRIPPKKDDRKRKSLYWLSWFGNYVITWTTNILYFRTSGEYEGCYKVFTRKLINDVDVKTDDFDFDNEFVCKAYKKGYKSVDVPIRYYPRSYSEGKHINWKHGVKILKTIIKTRFTK